MTHFPTESRDVVGHRGPEYEPYEVPYFCSVEGCDRTATERHHMFSRALMAGAYDWVELPDGVIVGNIIGLCHAHHEPITENKVRIEYAGDEIFNYDGWPLMYQPPIKWNMDRERVLAEEVTSPEKKTCPSCKRPMPKPKIDNPEEKAKVRKTWSVAVPSSHHEDGADVLDALLLACEELLDKHGLEWGEGDRVTYYKLSTVLGLFAQHGDMILSNG